MLTRTSLFHARSRTVTTVIAAFALAIGGGLIGAVVLGVAPARAAQSEDCPPSGVYPPIGNLPPAFTDNNIAVYAGHDFAATGEAAESEGVLVAMHDATFDKNAGGSTIFNVGTVGVGSQIAPAPGSVMLAVGNDLRVTAPTHIDVGAGLVPGGAVDVGGSINADAQIETSGATVSQGVGTAATAPYNSFGTTIRAASSALAGEPDTHPAALSVPSATFTGDGTSQQQVFSVTAEQLAAVTEIHFSDIPDGSSVVINVTGGPNATFSPTYFSDNGTRADDFQSPLFARLATRTLWNFVDATSVNIGGTSQVLGSILAPSASATITASTNGRVYVGQDIAMSGAGNELHNYPWNGNEEFGCVPVAPSSAFGTFSIAKTLDDPNGAYVGTRAFDIAWSCSTDGYLDGETVAGTSHGIVSVRPGDSAVTPATDDGPLVFPAGTACSVTEESPTAQKGDFDDDAYGWGVPTIAPASFVVGTDTTVAVTVTNHVTHETTPSPTPSTPTTSAPSTPDTSTPSASGRDAALADTGSNIVPTLGVALAAVLVMLGGAVALGMSRRRHA